MRVLLGCCESVMQVFWRGVVEVSTCISVSFTCQASSGLCQARRRVVVLALCCNFQTDGVIQEISLINTWPCDLDFHLDFHLQFFCTPIPCLNPSLETLNS